MALSLRKKISSLSLRIPIGLIIVISILYGVILANIYSDAFGDYYSYLAYAEHPDKKFFYFLQKGVFSVLFNEPFFLLMNFCVAQFFEPEQVIQIMIFISAAPFCYRTLENVSRSHFFLGLLILLAPSSAIGLHIGNIRQGVALAFFLMGWFSKNSKIRWILCLLSPFIHSSFFFILFFVVLAHFVYKLKNSWRLKIFIFFVTSAFIPILVPVIGVTLGARQASDYAFNALHVSFFTVQGMIFSGILLMLFLQEGEEFLSRYKLEVLSLIFFLVGTFTLHVLSSRILQSSLNLILLAGLDLSKSRKIIYVYMLIIYVLFGYLFKIDQPLFGLGG